MERDPRFDEINILDEHNYQLDYVNQSDQDSQENY
jgi:hypothetical protein